VEQPAPRCIARRLALRQNVTMHRTAKMWGMTLAACCLLLPFASWAQNGADDAHSQENRLVSLERLWNEAQVNRDANALARMIGDKFVNTEWDGEVSERGKFLADIADPRFKPIALTIQNVKVVFYGRAAVVTGGYHAKGTYQGKPYDHNGRFTDTWVSADSETWQCVASHTSLLQK
jgi:ketosteroid isomerase-like protein